VVAPQDMLKEHFPCKLDQASHHRTQANKLWWACLKIYAVLTSQAKVSSPLGPLDEAALALRQLESVANAVQAAGAVLPVAQVVTVPQSVLRPRRLDDVDYVEGVLNCKSVHCW